MSIPFDYKTLALNLVQQNEKKQSSIAFDVFIYLLYVQHTSA